MASMDDVWDLDAESDLAQPEADAPLPPAVAEALAPVELEAEALGVDDPTEPAEKDDEPEDDYFGVTGRRIGAQHSLDYAPIDGSLGYAIFEQRQANVAAQEERKQVPGSREHAEAFLERAKAERDEALARLQEEGEEETRFLTEVAVDFLLAPVGFVHSFPPDRTDPNKGFNDDKIPSARLWRQLGVREAAEQGKAAHADTHNDDAHSSDPRNPTFPRRNRHGRIHWNLCGCSDARAKVLFDFVKSLVEYRTEFVCGETVFDGLGLPGDVFRALDTPEGVVVKTIQRRYSIEPRHAADFYPLKLDVQLVWSTSIRADAVPEDDIVASASTFTHHISLIPHISMCFYTPPSITMPQLPYIQATQTVFDETVWLMGVQPLEKDRRIVIRSYKARMLHARGRKGFYVPPAIFAAGQLLKDNITALFWDEARVRAEASDALANRLLDYIDYANESGDPDVAGLPFLRKAVRGWQKRLLATFSHLRFPLPANPGERSALSAPAADSDGRLVAVDSLEQANVVRNAMRFPVPTQWADQSPLAGVAACADGRVVGQRIDDQRRDNGAEVRLPLAALVADDSPLAAPAATTDGRVVGGNFRDFGRGIGKELRYPIPACAADVSALAAPAATNDGRPLGGVWGQMGAAVGADLRFPYKGMAKDISALDAPAATDDGRVAGRRNDFGKEFGHELRFPAPAKTKDQSPLAAPAADLDGRVVGASSLAGAHAARNAKMTQPLKRALTHELECTVQKLKTGNPKCLFPQVDGKQTTYSNATFDGHKRLLVGVDGQHDAWTITFSQAIPIAAAGESNDLQGTEGEGKAKAKGKGKGKAKEKDDAEETKRGRKNWGQGDVRRGSRLVTIEKLAHDGHAQEGDVLFKVTTFTTGEVVDTRESVRHPLPKQRQPGFKNLANFAEACLADGGSSDSDG